MTPIEQGRYCGACQKTVIDFSLMSDQQVLAFLSKATTTVCGRLDDDQLNRNMIEGTARPSFSFRYFWSALVSGLLLMSQDLTAQTGKVAQLIEAPLCKPARKGPASTCSGIVLDSRTKQPIAHASITIAGVGTVAAANEKGEFRIADLTNKESALLEISAVGYDKREYILKVGEELPTEFVLAPTSSQMEAVSVIAYGNRRGCGRGGAVSIVHSVTMLDKVERAVIDLWPGKKSVTVYPNPATVGSGVKLTLNIKTTGEYKLELLDAGGRLVHVQALQVTQPAQVMNVPTQSSWSRGIYWVRVRGLTDKKIYHAKLVLQ